MAQAVINGDVVQVSVYNRLQEQGGINVRHFRVKPGGVLGITDKDFADYVSTGLYPSYISYLPAVATYVGVGVQILTPPLSPVAQYSTLGTQAGSISQDPLPKQVAGLAKFVTAYAGRKYRGRIYFPFPTEYDNDANDQPLSGALAAFDAIASFFASNQNVSVGVSNLTFEPVLYHKADGSVTPITGYIVRNRWATQRRRGDFGKTNILPI